MTDRSSPVPAAAPSASQAVTVVQPADRSLTIDVTHIAAWAVAIVAIAALIALLHKLLTREVSREIADVRHKVGNVTTRVDAIEHLRAGDIERIVRVETSIAGMEKGLERVERTINDRFDILADSIREIRTVCARTREAAGRGRLRRRARADLRDGQGLCEDHQGADAAAQPLPV